MIEHMSLVIFNLIGVAWTMVSLFLFPYYIETIFNNRISKLYKKFLLTLVCGPICWVLIIGLMIYSGCRFLGEWFED